jgi:hypothetical protein
VRKTVFAVVLGLYVLHAGMAFAQKKAVTEDGKNVILYPDGTWKYAEPKAAASKGKKSYSKPEASTKLHKGKHGTYGMWINEGKWQVAKEQSSEAAEFEINHVSGDAYAMVIAERLTMPLESLREVAISNAKEAAPDAEVVFEEKRTVNGADVLLMQINGTIRSIPFTYYSYYYSGKAGSIQVIAYTGQSLFDEFKADFEDLLNGFVVYK